MPQKFFENIDAKRTYLKAKKTAEKAKKKKQERKALKEQREQAIDTVPRSLVFRRGDIGSELSKLIVDFKRCVMMPYTAKQLQSSTRVRLFKDLIPLAQEIYVTHFLMFSCATSGSKLKISRIPKGPTLEFDITAFSTISDIVKFSSKLHLDYHSFGVADTSVPPLVVLNGFNDPAKTHLRLCATTFYTMFPPVDIEKFRIKYCRRVCLFSYVSSTDSIEWRYYYVDFSTKKDSALLHGADDADEESQETDAHYDDAEKKLGVKLKEMGPRLSMKLHKIYESVNCGEVLYHSTVKKTPEEILELRQRTETKKALKERRKYQQEENVEKKRQRMADRAKEKELKKLKAQMLMESRVLGENKADEELDDAEMEDAEEEQLEEGDADDFGDLDGDDGADEEEDDQEDGADEEEEAEEEEDYEQVGKKRKHKGGAPSKKQQGNGAAAKNGNKKQRK